MGQSRRLSREIRRVGDAHHVKGSPVDNRELVIGSFLLYLADGEGALGYTSQNAGRGSKAPV